MTIQAALLILTSAGLHAIWNLLGKHTSPSLKFMFLANSLGTVCLLPVFLFFSGALQNFTPLIGVLLISTGFFQTIYFLGLAGAYRYGDLSVAYPLLRSIPVLMVVFLTIIFSEGEPLSHTVVFGSILIVLGCLLIPLKSFQDICWREYITKSTLFALLAACGTAGYSMIDSKALRILYQIALISTPRIQLTAIYAILEGMSTAMWIGLLILLFNPKVQWKDEKGFEIYKAATLAGIFMYLSYSMVLFSMGSVSNVSYVVAFRQISIPLGAILGIVILKEPPFAPKLLGVLVAFCGLFLVGLG